eukprot:gnl/MRDRNA2_/MRDRNA2_92305_c0_seq1.p1 gnl/MRDRNA2_/MRDRNA2_92305_c0~~gnl/MRDRNA2_/MRDRNA2_92305_c0_seq1.p1  ORF type:complete len:571 (+),score=113.96 gnl/MRDRNA2_/MRDRNA2_92305_c0_seq1:78-1715(+)
MGDEKPSTPKDPQSPKTYDHGIPQPKQIWIYGINDHLETPVPDQVKGFDATGIFKTDFAGLCEKYGIVPHTALGPPRVEVEGKAEEKVLSISSMLLDRVSMQLMKCLIPTSLHLETIRFTSCKLDSDMLTLLRGGITDTSTVQTLQIEWNPLEVQLDTAQLKSISELSHEDLDKLERDRDKRDAERRLRVFRELLVTTFGTVDAAFEALKTSKQGTPAETLALVDWNDLTEDKLKMATTDSSELFDILDGLHFGEGDGKITLRRLREVLEPEILPELTDDQEANDPIGASFAQFVNSASTLENVSFRYCDLGRIEGRQIGEALKTNMHLRSLNLWGNRICDRGVQTIGEALEVHYALQYLGLCKNRVTHEGLKVLCKGLGCVKVETEAEMKDLQKNTIPTEADKQKKLKAFPPPKKDAKGRERYQAACHFDELEERTDENGQMYWLWFKNVEFKVLDLGQNPVSNLKVVEELQPWGMGELILRGTPVAKAYLAEEDRKRKEAEKSAADITSGRPAPIEEKAEEAGKEDEEPGEPPRPKGWTIHYS